MRARGASAVVTASTNCGSLTGGKTVGAAPDAAGVVTTSLCEAGSSVITSSAFAGSNSALLSGSIVAARETPASCAMIALCSTGSGTAIATETVVAPSLCAVSRANRLVGRGAAGGPSSVSVALLSNTAATLPEASGTTVLARACAPVANRAKADFAVTLARRPSPSVTLPSAPTAAGITSPVVTRPSSVSCRPSPIGCCLAVAGSGDTMVCTFIRISASASPCVTAMACIKACVNTPCHEHALPSQPAGNRLS